MKTFKIFSAVSVVRQIEESKQSKLDEPWRSPARPGTDVI